MCPPANTPPPSEFGPCWNEKLIFGFLANIPGSLLPVDVLDDCSPYDCLPSNLPEDVWYLVNCNVKKESADGFWKARGEPCEIYSDSMISGWRTTLEYFEGRAPQEQRSDWFMQEYKVTRKQLLGQDKMKDSRMLCRVFLCKSNLNVSENNSVSSINPTVSKKSNANLEHGVGTNTEVDGKILNSCPQTLSDLETIGSDDDGMEQDDMKDLDWLSSQLSSSCPSYLSDEYFDPAALLREIEAGGECSQSKQSDLIPMRPTITEVDGNIFNSLSEQDTIISGDFLELDDLKKPLSHSSSSETEYFDSSALPSSSRCNFMPAVRSNDIVLQPSSSGDTRVIEFVEGFQAGSTTEKGVQEQTTEPSGEKKRSSDILKKLKMCLCLSV